MRNRFLCAAAFIAAGAGPAAAADLAVRPPLQQQLPIVAAPNYAPDWAGFYIGFHGGGGWAHENFDTAVVGGTVFVQPNVTASGGVFGGHAGYNWQYGPVVGGIEVDVSGADIKESTGLVAPGIFEVPGLGSRETKVDTLASARARLGYAVLPNLLLYGTAGLGLVHDEVSYSGVGAPVFTTTADQSEFGWVAGAGLEYRLFEHLMLRAEWLHYDFGKQTLDRKSVV